MNSLSSQPTTKLPRRKTMMWLVSLLALTIIVLAVIASMNRRMGSVPADLDLSTQHLTQNGIFEVTYEPENNVVPINELHTWTLTVTTPDGGVVENAHIMIEGDMPGHGHGLATQPQVTQYLGDGNYLVEGLKFQMGGWWVMNFSITANGQTDTAQFNLVLK